MPITIGSNIASLRAQRELSQGTDALSRVFERLSSGQRINRASDDAAGLAIASSLDAQQRVLTQAGRNINDGISAVNIMEGALRELSGVVTRISELAEQSANGTYSTVQRQALDREAQALSAEFARIVATTSFNNINLLDGSSSQVRIQVGIDSTANSILSVAIPTVSSRVVGDGTFAAGVSIPIGSNGPYGISSGDFNEDGLNDLLMFGAQTAVHLSNGNGTFKLNQISTDNGAYNQRTITQDVNNDGHLDALYSDNSNLLVSIGNGNGTFKAGITYAVKLSGGNITGFELKDFNNDGISDFHAYEVGQGIRVLLGNSDGSFKAVISSAFSDVTANASIAGDVNGDGNVDLAVGYSSGSRIFLGNGNGTFSVGTSYVSSPIYPSLLADMNGDNILDFVVHDAGTNFGVGLGNGNGTFKTPVLYTTSDFNPGEYDNARVSDLNGDGSLDFIALAGDDDVIAISLNNGDGTFKAHTSYSYPAISQYVTLADVNNDGVLDILGAASSTFTFGLFIANTTTVGGLASFSLLTAADARSALDRMRSTLEDLNEETGKLGATQSRLTMALSSTYSLREGTMTALSRIRDADFAGESATLARPQILQRAATAVLAQANQTPALALTLLSG